ncbi:transcriptional regulator XRE family [Clostridium aceticum]|uniref:Transcriptional regulator XRE family n=1 Tax=Clostridium aceticum TaxID=84022 RepID=A0A0D8I8F8_9CLOT|nr:helix-turn-helix transcriptional regulator [Clostridium aceticum]AKL96122.1 transcriptional regulator XRE family [Clostridium aceticum]KJF25516.1 ABC transporter substrate-binding protein [Clostridium aceticum]
MKNNIKKLRKDVGLRQEDMAKSLGVTRQTINAIENEKYSPSLELAFAIAELFELKIEEIFYLNNKGGKGNEEK